MIDFADYPIVNAIYSLNFSEKLKDREFIVATKTDKADEQAVFRSSLWGAEQQNNREIIPYKDNNLIISSTSKNEDIVIFPNMSQKYFRVNSTKPEKWLEILTLEAIKRNDNKGAFAFDEHYQYYSVNDTTYTFKVAQGQQPQIINSASNKNCPLNPRCLMTLKDNKTFGWLKNKNDSTYFSTEVIDKKIHGLDIQSASVYGDDVWLINKKGHLFLTSKSSFSENGFDGDITKVENLNRFYERAKEIGLSDVPNIEYRNVKAVPNGCYVITDRTIIPYGEVLSVGWPGGGPNEDSRDSRIRDMGIFLKP
jgi:hypothetical protein